MTWLALITLLPAFNLLGGRGLIPLGRIVFRAVLMPLVVAWHFSFELDVLFSAFVGFLIWTVPGWGKYFAAWHGRYNPMEREQRWIDWVGEAVYPYNGDKERNHIRGALCMGLRGLYLMPFFVMMTPYSLYAPIIGMGMFLQGLAYYVCRYVPERHAASVAEVLTGLLIAVLILMI